MSIQNTGIAMSTISLFAFEFLKYHVFSSSNVEQRIHLSV